jgi:chitinase
LDHIHLMTYDFTGAWAGKTGFNAQMSDIETAVKYWVNEGADKSKLILGMPFYGKTFTLSNIADNGVGAGISGSGLAGPYTQEPGSLGYNEVSVPCIFTLITSNS